MELKIKRDSNFSIHIQLKEQIKGFILNNVLEKESQLPTVRQLEKILRINKNTVSKVYRELEEEGYVYSIKGKGTFVREKKNTKAIGDFVNKVDSLLKESAKLDISMEEVWGIIYYRSQKQKLYNSEKTLKGFVFVECNQDAIYDFMDLCKAEIKSIDIKGILIKDLKNNFSEIKKEIENYKFLVIPYLHYEEVKKELKKLDKEIVTIGTSQSFKILGLSKKIKNKNVGIVGLSIEDELAMLKQFNNIAVKQFICFNDTENSRNIAEFEKKVDSIIIYSEILNKIDHKFQKPYFVFKGKYDVEDMNIIKDIFAY